MLKLSFVLSKLVGASLLISFNNHLILSSDKYGCSVGRGTSRDAPRFFNVYLALSVPGERCNSNFAY